jgi:proline dehydrogenase
METRPKAQRRSPIKWLALLTALSATLLLYLFGEHWLRFLLLYLSHADWARQLAGQFPLARQVALRFVAGETMDEAMRTAQELNDRGMLVTMDYLGESVTKLAEAQASRDEILRLLDRIEQTGVNSNVSVKLTQLGLRIGAQVALDHMQEILARARQRGNMVRIDMEESKFVDVTLEIYRTLRDSDGFDNVGVVIQAYLYRSETDVRQLVDEGAWVRLCKGAYAEPPDVAFRTKSDTDANYVKLTEMMLSDYARQRGVHLGIATHDEDIVQSALDYAAAHRIGPQEFELQMLYGIRRELQDELVRKGYQVRVYVPYGTAWWPYFVRRLAERPANVWFFVSNLFRR